MKKLSPSFDDEEWDCIWAAYSLNPNSNLNSEEPAAPMQLAWRHSSIIQTGNKEVKSNRNCEVESSEQYYKLEVVKLLED